jgi:quercetin dioxygenase-like cupin family protein
MEIRRFGPGQRHPDPTPGAVNVSGQVIHSDARGHVSELLLGRKALIPPHTNPNTTWFIVISGGGFVQVGDERARVSPGEAILWPADVFHGAYTEETEMRAIVVELAGPDDAWARGILEGQRLRALEGGALRQIERGEGQLAEKPPDPKEYDPSSGEPW